jgi:hypothetical protein
MGVTYELIDAPYPYLCAVYRCPCGATATTYGHDAATPPAHWVREQDRGDGEEHVTCPVCDARRAAAQGHRPPA